MGTPIQRMAHALSDPLRVKLLGVFGTRAMSAAEVAGLVGMPVSNVAYHTRLLRREGLLRQTGAIEVRGATKTTYRVRTSGELRAAKPPFSQTPLGRTEAHIYDLLLAAVEEAAGSESEGRRAVRRSRAVSLDAEGWKAAVKVTQDSEVRIAEIAAECEGRSKEDGRPVISAAFELVLREASD